MPDDVTRRARFLGATGGWLTQMPPKVKDLQALGRQRIYSSASLDGWHMGRPCLDASIVQPIQNASKWVQHETGNFRCKSLSALPSPLSSQYSPFAPTPASRRRKARAASGMSWPPLGNQDVWIRPTPLAPPIPRWRRSRRHRRDVGGGGVWVY